MDHLFSQQPPPVSELKLTIGGINVYVYGLQELNRQYESLTCLWLLHPRGRTYECMAPLASYLIRKWNNNDQTSRRKGLIAASFDLRNHGERLLSPIANETWVTGDPNHAQNMFSIIQGSTQDVQLLIDHLATYLDDFHLPANMSHAVLGVSLGGHVAWQCLVNMPEVKIGIVVIGSCDYLSMMEDRAKKSKLTLWRGSLLPRLPETFQQLVSKYDPAARMRTVLDDPLDPKRLATPQFTESTFKLDIFIQDNLGGKFIFNMAGGMDTLVPHGCSNWMLSYLEDYSKARKSAFTLVDLSFLGVGHRMTTSMADLSEQLLSLALKGQEEPRFVDLFLKLATEESEARKQRPIVQRSSVVRLVLDETTTGRLRQTLDTCLSSDIADAAL